MSTGCFVVDISTRSGISHGMEQLEISARSATSETPPANDVTPKVGMGITRLAYHDCYSHTIIEVVNAKTLRVQRDKVVRTDPCRWDDQHQTYDITPDPDGEVVTVVFRVTKHFSRGKWVSKGDSVRDFIRWHIGSRKEYRDYGA